MKSSPCIPSSKQRHYSKKKYDVDGQWHPSLFKGFLTQLLEWHIMARRDKNVIFPKSDLSFLVSFISRYQIIK